LEFEVGAVGDSDVVGGDYPGIGEADELEASFAV
jgi:hypothetical protein